MKKFIILLSIFSLLSLSGAFLYLVPSAHATTTLEVGSGQTYATIQAAIDAIPSSPTNLSDSYIVNVYSGTYNEAVTVTNKLTTGTYTITIQNNTGDSPILDGQSSTGTAITLTSQDYVTISGLEIQNYTSVGISIDDSDTITVEDSEIHDYINRGIEIIGTSSGITIDNNHIHDSTTPGTGIGIFIGDDGADAPDNLTITDNIMDDSGLTAIDWNNNGYTSDTVLVSGNRIFNHAQGTQAEVGVSNAVFKNNILYNNDIGFANQASQEMLIENNTVYGSLCMGILAGSSNASGVMIVRNNIIANSALADCSTAPIPGVVANGYGAIAVDTAGYFPYSSLEYNLLYNNGWNVDAGNEHVVEVSLATLARGSYYGTISAIETTLPATLTGVSVDTVYIDDPLFTDPDGADNVANTVDDDFSLQSGSPAIDAGDPTSTYSNEPAPNGSRINLGAYGNTVYATLSSPEEDVNVTAGVDPVLTFTIRNSADNADSNTCSFGSMTSAGVNTCAYRLAAETNGTAGMTIKIQADGGFLSGTDQINDITEDGTVTAGTEGYGLALAGATGFTESGDFNDDDTPIPTSQTTILSVTQPFDYIQGDTSTSSLVTHEAGISAVTPAGTYTQTLTYTVTGNF